MTENLVHERRKKPRVSVVIPTLGRPSLLRTLESLTRARGFEEMEVVVVGKLASGEVQEQLQALARRHPQIHHLPVAFETGDSSRKKNAGFDASAAEVVAFLDDDVVVTPDWPEQILAPFADPDVGIVSGPSLVPEDVGQMARLAGIALASRAAGYVAARYTQGPEPVRPIRWSRIIGCNMAYRREVFEQVGHFDPAFWPGEEMIAAWKVQQSGRKIVFASRAAVYHYPRQTLGRFLKQVYGYGATRVRLIRAGTELEPTTLVPAAWVLSLLLLGIGASFSTLLGRLLILDVALYLAAAIWITFDKVFETRRMGDLLLFLLVPLMHLSYGLAEWIEFFFPGRDLSERAPGPG